MVPSSYDCVPVTIAQSVLGRISVTLTPSASAASAVPRFVTVKFNRTVSPALMVVFPCEVAKFRLGRSFIVIAVLDVTGVAVPLSELDAVTVNGLVYVPGLTAVIDHCAVWLVFDVKVSVFSAFVTLKAPLLSRSVTVTVIVEATFDAVTVAEIVNASSLTTMLS